MRHLGRPPSSSYGDAQWSSSSDVNACPSQPYATPRNAHATSLGTGNRTEKNDPAGIMTVQQHVLNWLYSVLTSVSPPPASAPWRKASF